MLKLRRAQNGVTLLELVIVVAVVAILAAIAMPSFLEHILRTRRSEAREALLDFATRQEQYFSNNKAYSASIAALGLPATTEEGYYVISIPAASTTTFTLRATAQPSQDRDTDCATMEFTSQGGKTPVDCW